MSTEDTKRSVITVNRGVDKLQVLEEILSGTGGEFFPGRMVELNNERADSTRNFDVVLTQAEVERIRQDPRIMGARWGTLEENGCVIRPDAVQQLGYLKKSDPLPVTSSMGNWGLAAISSDTNPFPSTRILDSFTREYSLDGTGVDLVTTDYVGWHTYSDHPDWLSTKTGLSRFVALNWGTASGTGLPNPAANFYTSVTNGHSTLGASLAAGKLYGTAKEAAIYTIAYGGDYSVTQMLSLIRNWHINKGTGRPTVVSAPWTTSYQWTNEPYIGSVIGGVYRGTTFSGTPSSASIAATLLPYKVSSKYYYDRYGTSGFFPYYPTNLASASLFSEVEACIDAGVILVFSAGNSFNYIDEPGGLDYNNTVTFINGSTAYYCRGTHNAYDESICVGAVSDTQAANGKEQVAFYSSKGPRIDVYAPGTSVVGAYYGTDTTNTALYPGSTTAKISSNGGTSFAAPMAAGVVCQLMQLRPWMTPAQCRAALRELASTGRLDESVASYQTSNLYTGPGTRVLRDAFRTTKATSL